MITINLSQEDFDILCSDLKDKIKEFEKGKEKHLNKDIKSYTTPQLTFWNNVLCRYNELIEQRIAIQTKLNEDYVKDRPTIIIKCAGCLNIYAACIKSALYKDFNNSIRIAEDKGDIIEEIPNPDFKFNTCICEGKNEN